MHRTHKYTKAIVHLSCETNQLMLPDYKARLFNSQNIELFLDGQLNKTCFGGSDSK